MDDPDCDRAGAAPDLRPVRAGQPAGRRLAADLPPSCSAPALPPTGRRRCSTSASAAGTWPARWPAGRARDGLRLAVTAIDPDPRALRLRPRPARHARASPSAQPTAPTSSRRGTPLRPRHVQPPAAPPRRRRAGPGAGRQRSRLARRLVVHNDLRRSRAAYLGCRAGRPAVRPATPSSTPTGCCPSGAATARTSWPGRSPRAGGCGRRPVPAARRPGSRPCAREAAPTAPARCSGRPAPATLANCALGAGVATGGSSHRPVPLGAPRALRQHRDVDRGAPPAAAGSGAAAGWWLLPAVVPLAVVPRGHARSRRHPSSSRLAPHPSSRPPWSPTGE